MEAEFREIDELGNWNAVYQEIRQQSSDLPCKIAKLPENRSLNRYRDVSPFDHSRIRLQIGSNDYINASLISVDEAQRNYILTQGPLPNTCGHFWEMVWEQCCRGVVMLNRVIEKGSTQETREILQFHYTTWPDFGVPESPASFLNFLFKVRESGCLSPEHGPVVVHCSAGIGRSGTFCLVDTCLLLMSQRKDPSSVRIQEVLLEMRRYRMGLIQTADQLRFSYLAVIEGAKYIMGDTSVQESWKELSNEEDLPPEFTPPPRPRPRIDPTNGKGDLVNPDTTHFFSEIIKNSAEICANSAPQTFTDGPELRKRAVAAGEVRAKELLSEPDDPIVAREAPPKPARSPPKTPTEEATPVAANGAWSPLLTSVFMCTVLAVGAYACYRTYFH
ncbi:tyrosine-protein phosphatase non-receptor type 1 isoform X2 [Sinocyclocheilus anshuiensis]|uniref:tyrosine-protein phosphatase non-receptor type 1 isoform X2 n=1 Tax=Sinocyclocheilus anshuiensis TaxID=1608454 RepID=UPI0007B7D97C|nr:PREDICTED: tyrosine-protein phosphatase non-receptor type 1-like isoform X2 [Sinocyclocheilus anshuiensis]